MSKNELLITDARKRFGETGLPEELDAFANFPRELRLYGPHERATAFQLETRYAIEPNSLLDGWLSATELKAVLIVHNEIRTLADKFNKSFAALEEVKQVLGISEGDLASEVLEGMADFVRGLSHVAAIRKMLVEDKPMLVGTKMQDRNIRYWYGRFANPIREDGLVLGGVVALNLVETVKEQSSRNVIDQEGIERWASRGKGAELAAMLYLSVLGLDREEMTSASNF